MGKELNPRTAMTQGVYTTTGTQNSVFRFQGQAVDTESQLYDLRARMYDPLTGQFLTVDPLLSLTGEPYAHAGDNPINYSDPGGLIPPCSETPDREESDGEGVRLILTCRAVAEGTM